MPIDVICPGCSAAFKVKDEHAGKKLKCPKCSKIVPIPAKTAEEEVVEDVEVVEDEQPAEEPAGDPFAFDTADEPARKKKGAPPKEPARPKGKTWGKYMPCPQCGGREAKRVKWTWWGSFYGPKMFTHVRCVDCSFCFNGKTGDTNLIPAILFVVIPLIGIIILAIVLYIMLQRTGHWPPWQGW
jgi:predicted Zn finger-like uncharacterized protein